MFNIKKSMEGDLLTVALEGRLDTITAPELEKTIGADVEKANAVVLDLKGLQYVSSAGLRVFLTLHKKMVKKGGLVLRNAAAPIREIFDFTGFSDVLNVE